MQYQESARRLEQLEQGFADATAAFTQLFQDLKLINQVSIPEGAPRTVKFAASAAIIAEAEDAVREAAAAPDEVAVAVQLGKIGDKIRIALPGGAILSKEEIAWIHDPLNAGKAAPPNLFYVLAQDQLAQRHNLGFTYDLDLATSGFSTSLRANLKRELTEEMGREAADLVHVGTFLPGDRTTTLTTLKLPDGETSRQIAEALAERGVTIDDKDTLRGIYTAVHEKVAVAHGPVHRIAQHSTDNAEAKGIRIKSLGELLDLARKTVASPDTYRDFRRFHSDRHGSDGIRNPSTTWGLGLLTTWLKERVIALDPYKEGARVVMPAEVGTGEQEV